MGTVPFRVPLLGGAYQARSLIASAQRSVNLYPERNAPEGQPPVPVTHYQTPGLRKVMQSASVERVRALYRATNGDLYSVVGQKVYYVSNTYVETEIGTIAAGPNPVVFTDNGLCIVMVDGSATGYAIDMATRSYGAITDPAFYGGTGVTYLDTYFVFNRPATAQFYISLSNVTYDMLTGTTGRVLTLILTTGGSGYVDGTYTNVPLTGGTGTGAQATFVVSGGIITSTTLTAAGSGYTLNDTFTVSNTYLGGTGSGYAGSAASVATAFDPLDIAAKSGSGDNIQTVASIHGELWLIGELTSEIWYNSGATDFTFQRVQGAFIDHGDAAPYSLAQADISLFWLLQDRQGNGVVVRTNGYQVKRISTHAIEQDIQSYAKISDAIGYCHQIQGHAFYVLTFPEAGKTWAYEIATEQWHERASLGPNGELDRHRGNSYAFAYGYEHVGDYQNGSLYVYDQSFHYDGDVPIPRIRSFPHLLAEGDRVEYLRFIADMEVGQPSDDNDPKISLRWSDTRGATYGNPVIQELGDPGQFQTSIQWRRLGMARDRVFEISWSSPVTTALNGAFVEVMRVGS